MIKKLYDKLERNLLIGNRKLQPLFESLYRFSLRGMNYDQAQSIETSGELHILNQILKKGSAHAEFTLFDVGANVGTYTKALSAKFKESKIYSFEALPSTFEILSKNVQGLQNVSLVNQAIGALKEKRLIYSEGAGSGLSSFYPVEGNKTELFASTVHVTTIDSFCLENGIDHIDFIKIDVEGFELEVLKGADRMIAEGKIKTIQFEFGTNHAFNGTHFFDIYKYLSNYKISRILKSDLRYYEHYDPKQEIYLAANYLAELKYQN